MGEEALELLSDLATVAWGAPQIARDVYRGAQRLRGYAGEFASPSTLGPDPYEPTSTPRRMPKRHHATDDSYADEETLVGTRRPLEVRHTTTPLARAVQACCLQERVSTDSRSSAAVSATGETVVCLNDFSQGTGIGSRVGDVAYFKKVIFKGYMLLPGTAQYDMIRMTIVLDHECFGTTCSYGNVFDVTTTGDLVNSTFAYGNKDRFAILFDKTFALQNQSATGAGGAGQIKEFEIVLPLHFKTQYNGNAGTVGDIVRNSLCLLQSSLVGSASLYWRNEIVFSS